MNKLAFFHIIVFICHLTLAMRVTTFAFPNIMSTIRTNYLGKPFDFVLHKLSFHQKSFGSAFSEKYAPDSRNLLIGWVYLSILDAGNTVPISIDLYHLILCRNQFLTGNLFRAVHWTYFYKARIGARFHQLELLEHL